jgi:inorganic pyrophosphatase
MNDAKDLKESVKFELQRYKRPVTIESLKANYISFSGSPRKHPYDIDKVILVNDPYSSNHFYYEFNRDDIIYVEELPSIVNLDNETIGMVRIWVTKNSIAVRSTPFIVGNTTYQW